MIYIFICISILFSTYCSENPRVQKIEYHERSITYTYSSTPRPVNTSSPESPRPAQKPLPIKPQPAIESAQKSTDDRKEYLELRGVLRDFIIKTITAQPGMTCDTHPEKHCSSCHDPLIKHDQSGQYPVQLTLLTACSHLLHKNCYDRLDPFKCACNQKSENTHYFYFSSFDLSSSSPTLTPLSSTIVTTPAHPALSSYQSSQKPASSQNSSTSFTTAGKPTLDDLLPLLSQQRSGQKESRRNKPF